MTSKLDSWTLKSLIFCAHMERLLMLENLESRIFKSNFNFYKNCNPFLRHNFSKHSFLIIKLVGEWGGLQSENIVENMNYPNWHTVEQATFFFYSFYFFGHYLGSWFWKSFYLPGKYSKDWRTFFRFFVDSTFFHLVKLTFCSRKIGSPLPPFPKQSSFGTTRVASWKHIKNPGRLKSTFWTGWPPCSLFRPYEYTQSPLMIYVDIKNPILDHYKPLLFAINNFIWQHLPLILLYNYCLYSPGIGKKSLIQSIMHVSSPYAIIYNQMPDPLPFDDYIIYGRTVQ